jgi:hypothetical protein
MLKSQFLANAVIRGLLCFCNDCTISKGRPNIGGGFRGNSFAEDSTFSLIVVFKPLVNQTNPVPRTSIAHSTQDAIHVCFGEVIFQPA